MKYHTIGASEVKVSYIALGGHEYLPNGKLRGFNEDIALATKPGYIFDGFGGDARKAVLRMAFDYGVNFFDVTQDSEKEALGRNLKELGTPYEIYIQTRPEGMVYTYDQYNAQMAQYPRIKAEAERILKFLRRDRIDFFNFAFMKSAWEHDPEYLEKIADNIRRLKEEGLIRFACADTFSGEATYLKQIKSNAFDVVYINFNFADDKATEKVFPACRSRNMNVTAREAFMKGELFHFAAEAGITDRTLAAHAAMKWLLNHEEIGALVYGTGKPHHLEDALKLMDNLDMTEEESLAIDRIKETAGYKAYKARKDAEFSA
jgi:aryl-alcohol dehydrogenase-like predicted oxidoreductase